MKPDRQFFRNLILYGIIGGLSSGLDALVFALLIRIPSANRFAVNTLSVHCGIFLSFFLNSRYNFKKTDHIRERFIPFYLTGLFGLLLSQGILWLGGYLGADTLLTKLVSIVIVALVQFFINRAVAFRDK